MQENYYKKFISFLKEHNLYDAECVRVFTSIMEYLL